MDKDKLNESLVKLRDELRSLSELDDASREMLQRLDGEIRHVLHGSGDVPPSHRSNLRESLQDSVQYLEASHPTITALMNGLITALRDMGI
jgi:hypothetical protein